MYNIYIYYTYLRLVSAEAMLDQERMWEDTLADDSATEHEARHGGPVPTEIDTQMMHNIQVIVSRLVTKARQLIRNFTTNLVEGWMQIRCKFDGGKVVNRSQSGSWEHRCYGAGLQQNLGKIWGPPTWEKMTNSLPNQVFIDTVESCAKKVETTRKRKATEKPRKADDGVSTPDLTTQLQLAKLIADMTMTSNLTTLLMMFCQNTWTN